MEFKIQKRGQLIKPGATQRLRGQLLETIKARAVLEKEEIIKRTKSGHDVKGQFFKGYVDSYKKQRAKMGLPTSPPDLWVTGDLLNSIQTLVKVEGKAVSLTLSIPADKKAQAEGLQKKREFFGQSKKSQREFKRLLSALNFKKVING